MSFYFQEPAGGTIVLANTVRCSNKTEGGNTVFMCASMCECDCVYVFMHAYINNLTHLISPLHSLICGCLFTGAGVSIIR